MAKARRKNPKAAARKTQLRKKIGKRVRAAEELGKATRELRARMDREGWYSGMKKPTKKRAKKRAKRVYGAEAEVFSTTAKKAAPKKRAKKAAPKMAAPKKSASKKAAPKKSASKARRTPLASKARPKTYLAKPHAPSPRKGPKKCKKCGLYHTVKEHASHRNVPSDWAQTQTVFSGLYGAAPRRSKKTDVRLALQAINVELAGPVTPARARKLHAERAKLLARARRAK